MNDETAFQAALDAVPSDWTTYLVFADWLEERGDPRADGYRMLGTLQRYPWARPEPHEGDWLWHNGSGTSGGGV